MNSKYSYVIAKHDWRSFRVIVNFTITLQLREITVNKF